jgi:FeS assembly SUF system protein
MALGFRKKPKVDLKALEEKIIEALKNIYDPEIPVNIYDLGLIYKLNIDKKSNVKIEMTLTSPGCPVAQTFPGTVESAVKKVEQVQNVEVVLVWDPPWSAEQMSEVAKLQLGLF